MDQPFSMWLYPVPAFVALVGWLFVLATQPSAVLLYGGAILTVGVGSYWAWRRARKGF
jgi:hypothetical protein